MSAALGTADLVAWLRGAERLVSAHAEELTALDAVIGDADHGTNMKRGMSAVVQSLDAATSGGAGTDRAAGGAGTGPTARSGGAAAGNPDTLLKTVGRTLVSTVGGASGPLYGTFFLRMGATLAGVTSLDAPALAEAVAAGVAGIAARGRSGAGEKTMLDAWYPAVEALRAHPEDLSAGVEAAALAAAAGRDATTAMVATKGRASYLGERSVGHIDPGAASTALIVQALAEAVTGATADDADGATADGAEGAGAARPGAPAPAATGGPAAPAATGGPAAPESAGPQEAVEDEQASAPAAPSSPAPRASQDEAPESPEPAGAGGNGDAGGDEGTSAAQVGLVLVSHSRALAEAARDLVRGLVAGLDVVVEIAAGLPDGSLGTDGARVAEAMTRVGRAPGNTGILVLTELGSAVMSAEAALEMIPAELAARTRLSAAPFVEGLVGAYAAAGIGRSLEAVDAEASAAPGGAQVPAGT